jgi:hypothetical protein
MVSKFVACWLIVLVLAPFTAPFPTCDNSTLFGGARHQRAPSTPASAALTNDSTVARVPGISGAGRIRFAPLDGVAVARSETVSSATSRAQPCLSPLGMADPLLLTTILRL